MKGKIPAPKSKFVKVKCKDCGNSQVLFDKAATEVKCLVCGATLATPSGGLAHVKGDVEEVLQ
jgi:small subunit ribosomal protein S27e